MMLGFVRMVMAAVGFIWLSAPIGAQLMTRVDLDNDSFNFWQAPNVRADREYTQGTRVNVLWPMDNALTRVLLGRAQLCGTETAERDCRMASAALAQSIYTPTLEPRRRAPDERPFAGWLGAEFGVQRDRDRALTAFSLSIGVTGKASLAESSQIAVHEVFGFRRPEGWSAQLPSEVTVNATYRGARELLHIGTPSRRFALRVAPLWSARLGSVATDATAGLHLTAGLRPAAPWTTAATRDGRRWGLFFRAAASQSVIGRNLFLDGSTFGGGPRVTTRNRWLGSTELGVALRGPLGTVEWRVHSVGREYQRQPLAHAYSTIAFALR